MTRVQKHQGGANASATLVPHTVKVRIVPGILGPYPGKEARGSDLEDGEGEERGDPESGHPAPKSKGS